MKTNAIRRNVAGFLPAILWAILLAFLSLSAVSFIPDFSWQGIIGPDKIAHAICYGILSILVIIGFSRLPRHQPLAGLYTVLMCSGFGALIEVIQLMMRAGRQFEYSDIVANVVGILIAYFIFKASLKSKRHGS